MTKSSFGNSTINIRNKKICSILNKLSECSNDVFKNFEGFIKSEYNNTGQITTVTEMKNFLDFIHSAKFLSKNIINDSIILINKSIKIENNILNFKYPNNFNKEDIYMKLSKNYFKKEGKKYFIEFFLNKDFIEEYLNNDIKKITIKIDKFIYEKAHDKKNNEDVVMRIFKLSKNIDKFKIRFEYKNFFHNKKFLPGEILTIDPGKKYIVSALCSDGDSFLIPSSHVSWFKREYQRKLKVHSICAFKTNTILSSKKRELFKIERNEKIKNFIFNLAKGIIRYCKRKNVTYIFVGYNGKDSKNEQGNWIYMYELQPLLIQLEKLCDENGIKFKTIPESYTSQKNYIDEGKFSGIRDRKQNRGQYDTKIGKIKLHSDINSCGNLMDDCGIKYDKKRTLTGLFKNINPRKIDIFKNPELL
jgi:hypothetical protein